MEDLQRELRRMLEHRFASDDVPAGGTEQLLTAIAVSEPLQRLIRVRMGTVTSLVREIRSVWGPSDLSVFTSSFVGAPSNIWMEGVSLPEMRGDVDIFHLLAYSTSVAEVNSDLLFCSNWRT